ncbi:hypothetical protein [Noviluteimonas gilva]|uniref:Uncharacterized protein n=1 Tax=Noviluteimonas gilva TaxID=2682097 RepID=A0A7C9I5S2_9GAMM|nr:hypothetical protein [Lysobacter gilvus]MUV14569.1 hypothetical protein [Lysobacter gilvus]
MACTLPTAGTLDSVMLSHIRCCTLVLMLATLCGCGDALSSSIADQFSESGRKTVDLASAVPGNWNRVCVLGPYSTNASAAEALGFDWPAETLTDIARNDGISVLIFVQGKSVLRYAEHPRRSGDFSNLTGRCFPRASAKFVQVDRPAKGWPGLFPADAK